MPREPFPLPKYRRFVRGQVKENVLARKAKGYRNISDLGATKKWSSDLHAREQTYKDLQSVRSDTLQQERAIEAIIVRSVK